MIGYLHFGGVPVGVHEDLAWSHCQVAEEGTDGTLPAAPEALARRHTSLPPDFTQTSAAAPLFALAPSFEHGPPETAADAGTCARTTPAMLTATTNRDAHCDDEHGRAKHA